MTHTSSRRILAASVAIGSTFLAAACGGSSSGSTSSGSASSTADVLRVGVIMSTSGPAAPFGASERNGAIVVLKDQNTKGGINGQKIQIFEADDKTDPTAAAQQARQLITQDKVDVLIGTTAGGDTLAMAPIAAAAQIPVVAPNGTIADTSHSNSFWPWVYRAAPSDLVAVKAMFDQVVKEGAKKIGVFAEQSAYGDGTLAYLQTLISQNSSLSLVSTARAALTSTDFTAAATKLTSASPDVMLLVTSAPAVGAGITRAIRQSGSNVPLWGPIGLAQQGFITGAGSAAEGVHMVAMDNWNDPTAGEKQLMALLTSNGYKATSYESAGSNAAQAVIAAAQTVKGTYSGTKIKDALDSLCGLDTYGLGKQVCYTKDNHDGYGTDALTMLVVQGGKFTTYSPPA